MARKTLQHKHMKQNLLSGLIFLSFLLFTSIGFSQSVWINEFHYDNDGGDTNEGFEIAGPEGTDLTGYSLVFYNGNGGGEYSSSSLDGIIPNKQGGYGMLAFSKSGIQNGPDALALVDPTGLVIQFISYEAEITATDGPANGMTSTDILVEEGSSTPVNFSLQLEGEGQEYSAFSWVAPAENTFGEINNNQDFGGEIVDPEPEPEPEPEPANSIVFINEIHYDNSGSDTGEGIEIAGTAGTDLSAYSIVLYNGADQEADDTIDLSGILPDQMGGYGTLEFYISGIQNGSPDGFALVKGDEVIQFLSYEGDFTAADGPAAGMLSTDIGVAESSSTPEGFSLQLKGEGSYYEDFEWASASSNTFGEVNNDQIFVSPEPIVFINELHYDNTGSDSGEGFEIAGTAGTDLSEYSIVFYNGSDQEADDILSLSGILPNQDNGYGTLEFYFSGIQNGSPDGLALFKGEEVIQFLSYEGEFIAADGPAAGILSTDIGVAESSSTAVGYSLQLTGEGKVYEDFVWSEAAANTFGNINTNQSFGGTVVEPEPEITEPISIAEARALDNGDKVIVEGVLTVSDQFGNTAYIQDETGGIAIYGDLVTEEGLYEIGDKLRITGSRAVFQESLVQISDLTEVELISESEGDVAPVDISLSELDQHQGELVRITDASFTTNQILLFETTTYPISDASAEAILFINSATNLVGLAQPEFCQEIIGVVGSFRGTSQLIPRFTEDLPCAEEYDANNGIDISYDQTLDVVTWNLKFFGFYEEGGRKAPAPEAIQKEAVKNAIIELNSDIIAVQEVVNVDLLAEMVSELDGYDFILSDAVSYPNSDDTSFGTQRVGFIYNSEVIKINDSKALLETVHPYYNGNDESFITDYPTGDSSQLWASGRLPFIIETTVTLDGESKDYNFVVVHAKSGDAGDDYQRREYDNAILKDSLDIYYGDRKLMLLGDYNDDVDQTIASGYAVESSYYEFLDSEDYWAVTKTLSESGYKSTVSYEDMIDHIMISDELYDNYVENSSAVRYDLYSSDYSSTTSDHYAVSARFTLFDIKETGKNNPEMVQLCHNGKPIFVSANAVEALLAKGAIKGSCSENEISVSAVPNPVQSETTINVDNFKNGKAYITVYSLSGNTVFTDSLQVKKGVAEYDFNMSGYTPGIYIIEVKNSFGQITYTKVVKR